MDELKALKAEIKALRSERTAWRITAENAEAAQSLPDGWKLVAVKGLGPLVSDLERAESKGYMPFAIEESWAEFDYQDVAASPAQPVQPSAQAVWNSPEETASAQGLVWLSENGAVFLGYHFEQPFREYRDNDGFYVGQQDAESYWARHEDAEPCEPDGWCQLIPPLPAQPKD